MANEVMALPTRYNAALRELRELSRDRGRARHEFGGLRRTDLLNSSVSNSVFRFATVSGQTIDWSLRRQCPVTSAQLGWLYASLCVVTLGAGAIFWRHGARLVLSLGGLELIVVGLAFVFYARHASDGEKIALREGRLVVELENGGSCERTEFLQDQVRIEPEASDRSLIEVSGQGRSVKVGRYVRPELRAALAREIRLALRGVRRGSGGFAPMMGPVG